MNDISEVHYRLALMRESMEVSGMFLLVKLRLKQLTIAERYELNCRAAFLHKAVEALNNHVK
jgi:hypothetical protein